MYLQEMIRTNYEYKIGKERVWKILQIRMHLFTIVLLIVAVETPEAI